MTRIALERMIFSAEEIRFRYERKFPKRIMGSDLFARRTVVAAAISASAIWGLLGAATPTTAQLQTAVEYGFRSVPDGWYDSFFYTASPEEIAALDAGALNTASGMRWERTGFAFDVWTNAVSGALPTCRFFYGSYSIAQLPHLRLDHFYTPSAGECAAVQANPDWHYQYEGIAFYLQVPDENGNCPPGTTGLSRLYNDSMGGWPVHMITTASLYSDFFATLGWSLEGDGRTFAFACAPLPTKPTVP